MVMVFALDAVIVVDVERPGGCVFWNECSMRVAIGDQ
jgi:hypothetical protein